MARRRNIDLKTVATIQRQLLWIILGVLVCWGVAIFLGMNGLGGPGVMLLVSLVNWGVQLAALVQVCRLAHALGTNIVLVVILGFAMLLPLINLLLLLSENGRATRRLKKAGLKVGLIGVSPEQLHRLREGACNGCGYDLAGLDASVCPECGLEHPLVSTAKQDRRALRAGLCVSCGYDLVGIDGTVCPECGFDRVRG
ncbi:MAG: hypothetical protein ACF8Q5_00740 [Phycisphaerales bacterium JB040]